MPYKDTNSQQAVYVQIALYTAYELQLQEAKQGKEIEQSG
jgi:hypothetical protein